MNTFLLTGGVTLVSLLVIAGLLHLFPRLGPPGRGVSQWLCAAPGLDLIVGLLTIAPLIAGTVVDGWAGLAAALLAQITAIIIWSKLHALATPAARKGPRIVTVLNEIVGLPRNYTALGISAMAIPVFWLVRLAEWIVYPPLVFLVRFPKYRQSDWVRVSRHKFKNLVGHDLIWCLYCDWMTGIWSLGSEMLRNIESFWCPIRFDSTKKCANCCVDFPDINGGWVPPDSSMEDVVAVVKKHYGDDQVARWFGHPARLTINGESPDASSENAGDTA